MKAGSPFPVFCSCSKDFRLIDNFLLTLCTVYRFIAFAPSAPSTAEATAIIAFRIISHVAFPIAIVFYLLSCSLNSLVYFRQQFHPDVWIYFHPSGRAYDSPFITLLGVMIKLISNRQAIDYQSGSVLKSLFSSLVDFVFKLIDTTKIK